MRQALRDALGEAFSGESDLLYFVVFSFFGQARNITGIRRSEASWDFQKAFFLSDNDRCDFVCIKIVLAEHDYLHGTLYSAVFQAQKRAPLMTLGSQ